MPGQSERELMELRDKFAGDALNGSCANEDWSDADGISAWCYKIADAMMAARDNQ